LAALASLPTLFGSVTTLPALTVAFLAATLVGSVSIAITVSVTVVVAALAVLTPAVAGIAAVFLRHCNKSLLVGLGAPTVLHLSV